MNCFDCALVGAVTSAVAFCHDCGAGVCLEHAVARQRHLTRTVTMNRLIEVEPPARLIRCHDLYRSSRCRSPGCRAEATTTPNGMSPSRG